MTAPQKGRGCRGWFEPRVPFEVRVTSAALAAGNGRVMEGTREKVFWVGEDSEDSEGSEGSEDSVCASEGSVINFGESSHGVNDARGAGL